MLFGSSIKTYSLLKKTTYQPEDVIPDIRNQQKQFIQFNDTVDGENPKQPLGMVLNHCQ